MKAFHAITCPLEGCVFIEASAGTGKTHSITSLVLRLILEKGQDVASCLLVTYTNAATDELRKKTRERLKQALRQVEGRLGEEETPDLLICEMLEADRIDPASAAVQIRQALLNIDELAVLTIHSFCQRILRDRAFESGQLFDTELEPDEASMIQEAVWDFWRILIPRQEESFFTYLRLQRRGLKDLLALAKTAVSRADAAVLPRAAEIAVSPLEEALEQALEVLRRCLETSREEVEAQLTSGAVNPRIYQGARIRNWLTELRDWSRQSRPLPSGCDTLVRFTNATLEEASMDGHERVSHEFYDLCDRVQELGSQLEALLDERWIQIKRDLLVYLRQRLPERKREVNRFAYEDLLVNALRALREPDSGLSEALSLQYPTILIDEFQDTDPTQYAIFHQIHECASHQLLCLIGDPKQAIYAFRGGDIFTYTHARDAADEILTLTENWRSSDALIHAVNAVYAHAPRPFWTEAIHYYPVTPASISAEARQRTLVGDPMAPMQIWQIGAEYSAYQTDQTCLEATCQEIARLIRLGQEGELEANGRSLVPSDIAILIRSHYQAGALQRRLQEVGVRSVSYDRQHVFLSHEAADFEIFLHVLASPRDENLLKAFLLSDLMGYQRHDLRALLADEGRWGALLETMAAYRQQWKMEGFVVMFRRFLREERLARRLLGLSNGERRLTNVLHLAELTEETQAAGKLSMHATLQWYTSQRRATLSEEKELRLESDDDRVRILTIHRSKGLEFPIVFMPFAWAGRTTARQADHVAFHRKDDEMMMRFIDVGSADFEQHRDLAWEEDAAEELRMLYVALTRAQHRVYLLCVPESPKYKTSSLAYLWHHRDRDTEGTLAQVHDRFSRLAVGRFREDYAKLVGHGEGTIAFRTWDGRGGEGVVVESETPVQEGRRFRGEIPKHWGITSYSGLAGHGETLELPDRDTTEPFPVPRVSPSQLSGMAALPRGTRTGNMLHLLYENLRFDADHTQIRDEAQAQLTAHGLALDDWLSVVTDHTAAFFRCDLGGFRLVDVDPARRLNELAFHFPIGLLTAARLEAAFAQWDLLAQPNPFEFHPVEGYLKGFIDLVFCHQGKYYVADYKSNFLGPEVEDYHSDRLPMVMQDANYVLQYHLYVVALHRYLSYRLGDSYDYERDFGGVFYLFVRGMDLEKSPQHGVYVDRPRREVVTALSATLSGQKEDLNG